MVTGNWDKCAGIPLCMSLSHPPRPVHPVTHSFRESNAGVRAQCLRIYKRAVAHGIDAHPDLHTLARSPLRCLWDSPNRSQTAPGAGCHPALQLLFDPSENQSRKCCGQDGQGRCLLDFQDLDPNIGHFWVQGFLITLCYFTWCSTLALRGNKWECGMLVAYKLTNTQSDELKNVTHSLGGHLPCAPYWEPSP